jgi:hypothetical protein
MNSDILTVRALRTAGGWRLFLRADVEAFARSLAGRGAVR